MVCISKPSNGLCFYYFHIFFLLYMHLRIAISVSKRSKNGVTHKVAARVKCKELRMIIETVFGDVLS